MRIVNAGGGPAAPAEAAGGSGLPFGLAAASPFLALLGHMVKDKADQQATKGATSGGGMCILSMTWSQQWLWSILLRTCLQ